MNVVPSIAILTCQNHTIVSLDYEHTKYIVCEKQTKLLTAARRLVGIIRNHNCKKRKDQKMYNF